MGKTQGVEKREKSIRLHFTFNGKPCKETLKTDGRPLPPTPANVKYANRIVQEIRDRIALGTFTYADYFPDSDKATTGLGTTVADRLESWIKIQTHLADSTISAYRVAVDFWKSQIGDTPEKGLKHSQILAALATKPKWTGKTRNNKVSVLRQALGLALADEAITHNPTVGMKASPHQRDEPDPFSLPEAEAILTYIKKKYGAQMGAYFEFKFFTGLRTGESLAVKWENIDFNRQELLVAETITLGMHKKSTKTNQSRVVKLNSRAMQALTVLKPHTFMLPNGWVFRAPMTGERWGDDSGPRKQYWMPALKVLGIRYRGPYHTRHTYATIMLMSGVTPAYGAKQLGHSVEMFLRLYSRWIDGGQNAVEMAKVESLIFPQTFPGNLKSG